MNLCLGYCAVLWLDSHTDHNKEPEYAPCASPKDHPIDH